ncbi:ElyC/SanA/YdcF family protein [Streptomyces sp. FL06-04B]|nr:MULTISPECIES: ElyC/SanA/YdcF family protein [Streptomyces]MDX2918925.1 ElyC/SanA/YdcF family protein [Streptomyces sp. NE06-03C]MDX3611003.1 ElyC/SanA/YdcF family protein [Streptomyces sp. FL06-04B]MDX3738926.1 ElyC/SanA/YdcF family protein [Streptomyces sp. ID01-15D]
MRGKSGEIRKRSGRWTGSRLPEGLGPRLRERLAAVRLPGRPPLRLPLRFAGPRLPGRSVPRLRERLAAVRLPRTRRGQRRLVQGLMVAGVLALAPATWMRLGAGDRVGTAAGAPAREVAVVFGAGLWNGRPTPYLAHRLDAAAELYRAGKVEVVLVTGDNSRVEYDEPDAMRTYLTGRGVPDRRIVSDYAGFDSWDSCVRAKKIFGVDRAVLVSQGFHIHRAVTLCRSAGIDAYGVAVDEPRDATWYYGGARELAASGKAALDALFRPDPRFLGPEEPGVAEALAAGAR